MKTTFKVFGGIMALGLVILLCLHLFLQFGLTKAMREVVLPRIKAETGINARVGRLSINIPNGTLDLKEVEVKNPDGFLLENLASIDRIQIEFDILSLFKMNPVLVESIEVENALLNVIRNKDGVINLERLTASLPPSGRPAPSAQPAREAPPRSVEETDIVQPEQKKPLPELLVRGLLLNARIRYLDLKLDQLDIVLDLGISGGGLSTQRDPSTPWGDFAIIGSLGDDRTRFITDLKLRLAPLTNPQQPTFDLTGRVLEIDPRIMEEAYSRLGIRSAPFGVEPLLYCRSGRFTDSVIALNLRDIKFEDKLADRLGGTASIGSLRFTAPVKGTLRNPEIDIQSALAAAFGDNSRTLLEAFLKGTAAKEAGLTAPPETMSEAAVEVLAAKVNEIGESEAAQQALKDLAGGEPSDTNAPAPLSSDTLVEILGEQVDEIGENEEIKDELKNLGKWLFGK